MYHGLQVAPARVAREDEECSHYHSPFEKSSIGRQRRVASHKSVRMNQGNRMRRGIHRQISTVKILRDLLEYPVRLSQFLWTNARDLPQVFWVGCPNLRHQVGHPSAKAIIHAFMIS